ncbi:MAG TPA: ferredoxin reductase [Thermomicrobiales bacterium]|nr:ferredoxin reductase [Thermomicrobiales bacterium]
MGRLDWQLGTVRSTVPVTPRTHLLTIELPGWEGHLPGQHVDVRLTAEDGYQAQRSYSIASASHPSTIELAVERLDDGEVSAYLTDVVIPGDQLELRGPIGGYFTWTVADGGPVLLVAGGSGVAPLMSMIRQRFLEGSDLPMRLLYSSRAWDEIIYHDELTELSARNDGFELVQTLTRRQPPGWTGYSRRIDRDMLESVAYPADSAPLAYVCGPTALVESAAGLLVELGYDPLTVKTERFGPTG